MKLDNQSLMSEFHQEIKEKYPDVDYNQIKDICFGPWMFLKKEMESGELKDVRFEFFGVFKVHEKRVDGMIKLNDRLLQVKKITEDKYNHYKNMYEKYKERKKLEK